MRRCLAVLTVMLAAVAGAAKPKYVFLFIGDGMSMPQRMAADEFAKVTGYGELAMNRLPYQCMTRTQSANKLVTDSAASATAIACGEKTDNGMLGVDPQGRRLESVAAFARRRGLKVGVMTTVTITHATPGGFYAHQRSRGDTYRIGLDLLESGFDFFAGGGMDDKQNDEKDSAYRGNVFELAAAAGYWLTTNRAEFAALRPGGGKVWAPLSRSRLDFSIDAREDSVRLSEIVAKAVELLDNPAGFLIMAEGGTVDYGGHANDAATVLQDILELDRAVKVALEFQRRHPEETLIVTTGDHETGGLSMGFAGTGNHYYLHLLARQRLSAEKFSREIEQAIRARPKLTFAEIRPRLVRDFGFVFEPSAATTEDDRRMLLSAAEQQELAEAFQDDVAFVTGGKVETTAHDARRRKRFANTVKRIMATHAGVSFSTGSHTAMPTMTTASGPGAEGFVAFMENTDIARKLKELLTK